MIISRKYYDRKTVEIEKCYQQFLQMVIQAKESPSALFDTFLDNNTNSYQLFNDFYKMCNLKVKTDIGNFYEPCR